MTRHALASMAAICSIVSSPAVAYSAVAIGQPSDIAKGGLAIGAAWDQDSREKSEAAALAHCRAFVSAPESTRNLCRVVAHFDKRCMSIALDPRDGTYGFGWAMSDTLQEADDIAMTNCRATAREEAAACVFSKLRQCDQ